MKEDKTYNSFFDKLYSEITVIRGKLLVFSFILFGAFYFGKKIFNQNIKSSIPNTFEFHSEMKYDSVSVEVCGLKTKLFDHETIDSHDSKFKHSGNVVTPARGYPCPVEFTIHRNGRVLKVKAPDFDCNHCGVAGHIYTLAGGYLKYSVRH